MDDPVEVAMRHKRDSSMRVAISQLKPAMAQPPRAQACVSAGNTGALMAVARYVLKTIDGIERPAIASLLPNQGDGTTTVLDLGANVDCTAEHLLQFAVMGSALAAARNPTASTWSPVSACSTSAKRSSRAAKPSSAPANCCAPPVPQATSTSTATSKATTSSRAPATWSSATASSAT
jgi:hypothetical protein